MIIAEITLLSGEKLIDDAAKYARPGAALGIRPLATRTLVSREEWEGPYGDTGLQVGITETYSIEWGDQVSAAEKQQALLFAPLVRRWVVHTRLGF